MKYQLHNTVSAVVLMAISGLCSADVTLNMKRMQAGNQSTQVVNAVQIRQGKVRIGLDQSRENNFMVFDSQQSSITHVNGDKQQYMVIDQSMVNQALAMQATVAKQMEARLSQLPPEQRQRMKSMMEKMMPTNNKQPLAERFEAVGRAKVNGHDCKQVNYFEGDVLRSQLCVVDRAKLGISDADYASLKSLQAFAKKLLEKLPKPPTLHVNFAYQENNQDMVPVQIKLYRDQKVNDVIELHSIDNKALKADVFSVPGGYQKQQLPKLSG